MTNVVDVDAESQGCRGCSSVSNESRDGELRMDRGISRRACAFAYTNEAIDQGYRAVREIAANRV